MQDNKKAVRLRGTDSAKIIQIIETKSLIGSGTDEDPARYIFQYWDFDGNLIASKEQR